jgi:hypothetical protein
MNVLLLSSSPNHDGLTAACTTAAVEGITAAGGVADTVLLNDLDVGMCRACDRGWGTCLDDHRRKTAKRITVRVPDELVRRAKRATGLGLALTVRRGLELVAARETYLALQKLRGKVKLSIDLDRLSEDRD